jgi:leader peptidase (prepilin peptidase) / N-methyltransferase
MDTLSQWIVKMGWFLVAWLFALGAVVGSFLNVVVYRLPAGKSLLHPGSCCPDCGHPIRWYHNLPILSWFLLRGRCFDCGARISPRYPLVEFATALLFLGLAALEVWPDVRAMVAQQAGDDRLPASLTGAEIVVRYGYHLWLLCTLLCATLMEIDRRRVPRRLMAMAVLVGLAGAAFCPAVRLKRFAIVPASWPWTAALDAFAAAIVGLLAGLLAGWIFGRVTTGRPMARKDAEHSAAGSGGLLPWSLSCVGTFLGWQGAVAVGIVAMLVFLAIEKLAGRRGAIDGWSLSGCVLLGTLGWIVAAHWWAERLLLGPL